MKGFSFSMISSEKRNKPVMIKILPKTKIDNWIRMRLFKDCIRIAVIAKNRNAILNIKCSVHPNFSRIPPQEQGTNELKFRIMTI
ncbi:hypothetical protein D3C85_1161140 [compost metagenome]